nr:MAG TPA: hypothetical protein [Caudoviricetes sp.]
MSKEEQIQELENELFNLEMKDRWSNEDYIKIQELRNKIKELKND